MKLSKNSFNFGEIPLTGVYNDSIIIEDNIEDFHCLGGSCFCVKVSKEGNKIDLEFTPSKSIMDFEGGNSKSILFLLWKLLHKNNCHLNNENLQYYLQ